MQRSPLGTLEDFIRREDAVGARNYAPLDVVIERGEGAWVYDVDGRRYLDCISAYSALNHGHRHPRVMRALQEQAERLTLTSRAVRNDRLGPFLERLAAVARQEAVLPMNTGAEAVETAIKLARRWGYRRKQIAHDCAEIVVFDGCFHGRTTTIVGFSTTESCRRDFGPFTGGFRSVPFGQIDPLRDAIRDQTCAVLIEPIQGEGGINVPPPGYLRAVEALCRERGVLLIADEIQTGLGRTGALLACDHESVKPDILVLGKALGGGVYPVSAVLASWEIMGLFAPGDHGSTFGGNPLASAVALEALNVLVEEGLADRARDLGAELLARLNALHAPLVRDVRGRGLLIGIEVTAPAHLVCELLLREGILAKDTHDRVIRIAPPLVIDHEHVILIVDALDRVLRSLERSL